MISARPLVPGRAYICPNLELLVFTSTNNHFHPFTRGFITSTMTTEKPSIVLIQGSFQTPLVYAKLTTGLRDLGYPVTHPSLPSCIDVEADDFPTRTMEDDARTITETLQQLIEKEGKSVVVVMHSYGGIVGSTAIPQFLAYTSRQAEGKKGGVLHLFYYAAFVLPEGASVMGTYGESPNNYVTVCFPSIH